MTTKPSFLIWMFWFLGGITTQLNIEMCLFANIINLKFWRIPMPNIYLQMKNFFLVEFCAVTQIVISHPKTLINNLSIVFFLQTTHRLFFRVFSLRQKAPKLWRLMIMLCSEWSINLQKQKLDVVNNETPLRVNSKRASAAFCLSPLFSESNINSSAKLFKQNKFPCESENSAKTERKSFKEKHKHRRQETWKLNLIENVLVPYLGCVSKQTV